MHFPGLNSSLYRIPSRCGTAMLFPWKKPPFNGPLSQPNCLPFSSSSSRDKSDELIDEMAESENYAFAREVMQIPGTRQKLFLVQPRVKIGPRRNYLTTPALQLAENITLLETLGWEVVDSLMLPVDSLDSRHIFGSGNFEMLMDAVKARHGVVSGLFVATNMLKSRQMRLYREEFRMPIYDRYRIVLEIFRAHARTKEARLQVALAELPYLRSVCSLNSNELDMTNIQPKSTSSSGQTLRGLRKQLVQDREMKIKNTLGQIRVNRALNRQARMKSEIPSIAVVGYTNCGKTTLIRTLTGDTTLVPENKLFATLDVTSHAGPLPSNITALFMDTIGFISDIPTQLISSFAAVLEEVALADVIVHVRDISHPDTRSQKQTVLQQLKDLKLPEKLLDNVIEVCNKCDLVADLDSLKEAVEADENAIFISATTGDGVYDLRERMQEVLLGSTGLSEKIFRIPQSGKELSWLYSNAHVHFAEADPTDTESLLVHATITPADLARFVHQFRRAVYMNKKSSGRTPAAKSESAEVEVK